MYPRHIAALVGILLSVSINSTSLAVNPDEILQDPQLEQRARQLSKNLRCLVCQNQSIDDSDADLAKDLRVLLRKRLVAGDSDEEVINYIVSRYGEFVLLTPRLSLHTMLLWLSPLLLLMFGAFLIIRRRNHSTSKVTKLSDEEEERLEKLLSDQDQ